MKVYPLYFSPGPIPQFLGIGYSPQEGENVVTTEAKPSQVGVINSAARSRRDMSVDYIPPSHPGAPATVRVRTWRRVEPQKSIGTILHYPDGSRVFHHLDGTREMLPPMDEEAW